jgi:hypothetical protein
LRLCLGHRLRHRRHADLQRIGPHRLGDVLERRRPEIGDRQIEPSLDLPVGLLGEADCPRLRDPLQARGDVDPVAHQVAVALLDHVTQMNADAKFDAPVLRHARVALDHGVLHFDRAAHGVDHAAKLDDRPIAGAFHHPAVVDSDGRIDEIAAQRPEARQNPILVRAGESAEADDIRRQDRCEFSPLGHAPRPRCKCHLGRGRQRRLSVLQYTPGKANPSAFPSAAFGRPRSDPATRFAGGARASSWSCQGGTRGAGRVFICGN